MTRIIVRIISSRVLVLSMQDRIEIIKLSRCHTDESGRLRDPYITVDLITSPVSFICNPHNDKLKHDRLICCSVSTYGVEIECKLHSHMTRIIVRIISSRVLVLSMQDRIEIIKLSRCHTESGRLRDPYITVDLITSPNCGCVIIEREFYVVSRKITDLPPLLIRISIVAGVAGLEGEEFYAVSRKNHRFTFPL